jgi:hypothetical protein
MTGGTTRGISKTLQGLRTGDQRTLYTGVALVAYSVWRRKKGSRKLVYRRVLRKDQALLIRAGRRDTEKIVVPDDLADQVEWRKKPIPSRQRNR